MDKIWLVLFAVALSGPVGCSEIPPPEWPKDCVGRLQLSLPGIADHAAILGKERFRDSIQYGRPQAAFPDGELAGWTDFSVGEITHPFTANDKIDAKNALQKIERNVANGYKSRENIALQAWPIGKQEGMGWFAPNRRVTLNLFINGSLFTWSKTADSSTEFAEVKEKAQNVVNHIRPRPFFDVPSEHGLCLPYVFIPDSGQEDHAIAMTYRLKEHPDITINLRSKSAESDPKEGDNIRPDAVTNDFQTDLYWGAYLANVLDAKSLWHLPAKRPMHLAGRAGLETFLAVVRSKGSEEDYIYHAVARGDPNEPENVPDVRLVVEQNRQSAIKRGIQPLTQNELLKLARQIAASVTVRESR